MKNLVCSIYFDRFGNVWAGTGLDGQLTKLDRDGNVIGAMGPGPGRGEGNWGESSYLTMDSKGNIFSGDTGCRGSPNGHRRTTCSRRRRPSPKVLPERRKRHIAEGTHR